MKILVALFMGSLVCFGLLIVLAVMWPVLAFFAALFYALFIAPFTG